MTTVIDEHNHVLFRAIAITTTTTATPEVREIATVDATWQLDGYSLASAELRLFSTSADEDELGLPACNPSYLTNILWEPTPNVIVVHDGPSARLIIPREFTRRLPWIDTYRTSRILLPGLWRPKYHLVELIERLGLRPFVDAHVSGMATRSSAAWNAAATAALLSVQLHLARERELSKSPQYDWLECLFQPLAAPAWIKQLIDISNIPAMPLRELPAAWDDDADWAVFGDEDVAWAVANEQSGCWRPALLREVERRRRRDEQRPCPLVLCRRPSP